MRFAFATLKSFKYFYIDIHIVLLPLPLFKFATAPIFQKNKKKFFYHVVVVSDVV